MTWAYFQNQMRCSLSGTTRSGMRGVMNVSLGVSIQLQDVSISQKQFD